MSLKDALLPLLQQMVQVVQNAPDDGDGDNDADDMYGDDGGDAMPDGGDGDPYADEDDAMPGEMAPPGAMGTSNPPDPTGNMPPDGGSLHDRVSQLESHTGLKKSASNLPLVDRISSLEDHYLGETYTGAATDRVEQLESVAGLAKSAAVESAPDEIDLPSLIKAAAKMAVTEALSELNKSAQSSNSGLPDPGQLRKTTRRQGQATQSRRQRTTVSSDEDLAKSIGLGDGDLDEPVSFGDVLQLQYNAQKAGLNYFPEDEDED